MPNYRNQDASPTGHVLGDARVRQTPAEMTHRQLTGVTQAALRALTHLALLVGITNGPQVIAGLVQHRPQGDATQLGAFLWQHLRADLFALHRSLGRNFEESLLALHLLVRDLYLRLGR